MASGLFAGLSSLGGSTLGQVLVAVGLDTSQLDKGLAKAKADATTGGKAIGQIGLVAKAAFAAAGVAATKFAVDSVKAFNTYQVAVTGLSQTLQTNTNIIDKTTGAFEEYARSLSRVTGFTDTEIIGAQALFAQYGLNRDQIEALTQISLAYARVTGKDVQASAAGLGKALLGSGKAIKAIGQDFEDTGTLAGNFNEIIHLVGPSVEGAAAQFAGTGAGALAKFGAAWENLKVSFGEGAAGPLASVLNYLTQVLTYLPAVVGTVENAFINLANVFITSYNAALRFFNIINVFGDDVALIDHLEEVNHEVSDLTPRLGLAATKFGFVGSAAEVAAEGMKEFHDRVGGLKESFNTALTGLDSVKKGFEGSSSAAVKGSGIIARHQQIIAQDLGKLDKLKIGEGLKDQLLALGPDMVHNFVRGNANQKQKILDNLKIYNEAIKETNNKVKKIAGDGGKQTGIALIEGAIEGISAKTPALQAAAAAAIQAAVDAAKAKAGIASASKVFRVIGQEIMQGLRDGIEKDAQLAVDVMQKVVDKFTAHFDALKQRASDFKNSIGGALSAFKGDIFGSIGGLFNQTDEAGNPIVVTGTAISGAISGQVQQAAQLAAVLRQLSKAGLSQQLLSQVAGQGAAGIQQGQALLADPSLIAQANSAFSTITSIAQTTSAGQETKFFGESIHRARDRMDELTEALKRVIQVMRMIQGGEALRDEFDRGVANAVYRTQRRRQSA